MDAMEIGVGNFVLGTTLNTNYGAKEGGGVDLEGESKAFGNNRHRLGAWVDGMVYSSPLYAGFKQGNNIMRVGLNNPWVQDHTQNWVHRGGIWPINRYIYQNYYNDYSEFQKGVYSYFGYYNPYTLYSK